ncbi:translation initiation factor IF-3 [Erysipelothrix sp. HDW6C]|uniref:translation initiation factor IF-3 n=1 Tax=Erysipelothrix sp. HDW6C TaxID=2714930 RepID=UPI00196ABB59|nr:translation initiation factor IF-3 [Erysipelothrix sp. HDW6C]
MGQDNRKPGPDDMINDAIRFKELLVIGPNGEQYGIMMRREALEKAYESNLDLMVVAPNGNPPVAKILDYGRYRYELQKKNKDAKRNQHVTQIKPLRLSPVIDQHDFDTKLRHARKWLEEGTKVKVDMRFRGRMMTRIDVGRKTMDRFIEECKDLGSVEKMPKLEGNTMSVVISPNKK